LRENEVCTVKGKYGLGAPPYKYSLSTCARLCYESSRCSTFAWSSYDGYCTDEGFDGGHNCPDWTGVEHTSFYQLYVGCGDMLPIISHIGKEWLLDSWQGKGSSYMWEYCPANSYKCGGFCCCDKGFEANWEGRCVRTENCGATCTFSTNPHEKQRIKAEPNHKVEKPAFRKKLDECGKACLDDPTCFGFEFENSKEASYGGQCYHVKRNTLQFEDNENWDAWIKVCNYENGDPGFFQSSATGESVIDTPVTPVQFSLLHGFALIGLVFIIYSCKNCKKQSEYVDVPSGKEQQEI